MHPEFGSIWIIPVGSEAAAPDMLAGADEEDRPVLNAVTLLGLDLALETGLDLAFGQLACGYEPGDGRVAPERTREREVGLAPKAEPDACRLEEEVCHAAPSG